MFFRSFSCFFRSSHFFLFFLSFGWEMIQENIWREDPMHGYLVSDLRIKALPVSSSKQLKIVFFWVPIGSTVWKTELISVKLRVPSSLALAMSKGLQVDPVNPSTDSQIKALTHPNFCSCGKVCAGPHFPLHLWRRRQHHAACRKGLAKHLAGHGGPQGMSAPKLI